MTKKEVKAAIRQYYSDELDFDSLKTVIDIDNFKNREFGFQLLDGHFVRNISFRNFGQLRNFFEQQTPISAYIGAVYDNSPSRKNPIASLNWKYREFVFDLDLDEWDHVRTCGCQGASEMCPICWKLVLTAAEFIDKTLHDDFGFNEIYWVFSGRRGVHAWIISEKAAQFDTEQRSAIIDYMTLIRGHDNVERALPLPNSGPLKERILSLIVSPWIKRATKDDFVSIGISKHKADRIMKYRDSKSIHDIIKELAEYARYKKKRDSYFLEKIILLNGPRIDKKVSIDLRRILRMPGSLHGKTGKKVVLFDSLKGLMDYNPFSADSFF